MKTIKKFTIILLALLFCVALAACGGGGGAAAPPADNGDTATTPVVPDQAAPTGDNVIKIGALVNLTGYQAPIDLASTNEIKAYIELVNGNGGWDIDGTKYQLELITSDMESDPTLARSAALYLVDQGVKYVIETVEFMVTGVQDIWDENKIMHISTWPTGDINFGGPNHPYAFLGAGGSLTGYKSAMQNWLTAYPQASKLVYCENDSGNNDVLYGVCKGYADELGLTLLPDKVIYAGDQTDFSSVAMSLIKTGAEGFIGAGPITNVAAITKELRNLGSDMWYVMPGTQSLLVFSNIVGADGARNAVGIGALPIADLNNQVYMDTYEKYKEMFGEDNAAIYNGNYPSCVYQLLQFMSLAKSTDVDTVISTIEATDTVDTFFGQGRLGGTEYYGMKNRVVCNPAGVTILDGNGKVSFTGYIDAYLP